MKTNMMLTAFALSVLMTVGCKGRQSSASQPAAQGTTSSAAAATTPEQLGALGAEIKKHPNDAHHLIQQHGLSEESFAAAIRKVSEDPAASKRYAAAYKQAGS